MTTWRRLAPAEALRQLKPGRAVLLYGHLPPARLHLRAWFRDRRLGRLAAEVAEPQAAVPQHAPAIPLPTRPEPDAGTAADEGVA